MTIRERAVAWREASASYFKTKNWGEEDWRFFRDGLDILSHVPQASSFVRSYKRYDPSSRARTMRMFMSQAESVREPSAPVAASARPLDKPSVSTVRTAPKVQPVKTDPVGPSGRVRHLDEYVNLLPQELRDKAAGIRQEYILLAEYRNQADRLVFGGGADKSRLAELAQLICHQDDKIRNFWDQVHEVLRQSEGGGVDHEVMERLQKEGERLASMEERGDGEWTADEILRMEAEADTEEKRQRVAYLRKQRIENRKKYIRKPIQDSAERDAKVRMAVEELRKLGVPKLSGKIVEIALSCGMGEEELW